MKNEGGEMVWKGVGNDEIKSLKINKFNLNIKLGLLNKWSKDRSLVLLFYVICCEVF